MRCDIRSMMRRFLLLGLSLSVLAGCAGRPDFRSKDEIIKARIIQAAGADRFDQVEQIRFTFNVERPNSRIARSWVWRPHDDRVTLREPGVAGPERETAYNRGDVATSGDEDILRADKLFVNDSFWLLTPLHLAWSKDVKIEDRGETAAPIGGLPTRWVVVTYPPNAGGYTPGDVYELFLDDRDRISQWIFRRGGSADPTLITTFENHVHVPPLTIAMDHRGVDGKFRLWFTDVSVTVRR